MMNRNKFGVEDGNRTIMGYKEDARIICDVDWNQISQEQSVNQLSHFKEKCFIGRHISLSESTTGAALLFGKKCFMESKFQPNNKTKDKKLEFLRHCLSKKRLVVASTNKGFAPINKKDHAVYFSKVINPGEDKNAPDGYIEVIESCQDIHKISFDDLNKFSSLCAVNLPDIKEKKLDKYENSDEKQLENTKIGKNDKNFYDNDMNLYVNNHIRKTKNFSEIENKQKKSCWLFKILTSLAIIFAVLSILAFALELALALKIVFTCLATACLIGLIMYKVVNHYRQEKPDNVINQPLSMSENSIINKTHDLEGAKYGGQRENQSQYDDINN